MSGDKILKLSIETRIQGLWSGKFPGRERESGGERIVVVELGEPCDLSPSALRSEIDLVVTPDVTSAIFIANCNRLSLTVRPGCKKPPAKLVREWFDALSEHITGLPDVPYGRLFYHNSADAELAESEDADTSQAGVYGEMSPELTRVEQAMAVSSPTGFNDRGR